VTDLPRSETATVTAERLVAGGAALARRDDGRVVLVDGALPGEVLDAVIERRHGTDRGRIVRVIEASPERIDAECPHVIEGCGGCDLATLSHSGQVPAKIELVTDSLRRIGRWADPVVRPGPALEPWSFRTTLRLAIVAGQAGLRRADSHDVVGIEHCAVAHPLLDELVSFGDFGSATEAMIRVGAATGERMAVIMPNVDGVRLPADVLVVGADELASGRRAWIHERVGERTWRISADSFFQTRPDGAAALVGVVVSMLDDLLDAEPVDGEKRTLIDAYCGVGLFAGSLLDGRPGWRGLAAERSRSSVADCRTNLADLDVRVVGTSIERLRTQPAEIVVADPSRAGLGRKAVKVLAAAGADRFVLVSCDPASAGRDVALLASEGYRPIESVIVDLFPHTHHTEIVTRLDRS
jgi:23S rRNA (uracil1939-C5)-methyltransferase